MAFFPTQVIVGIDGTPESHHALEAAVELCRATGSSLHLLHVELTSGTLRGRPMTPRQREVANRDSQQLLDREAAAVAELGLEVAGTHLRYGEHLARAMAHAAEELDAGLLVIGESRSGHLPQSLTATFSTTTVRRSKGSVLVVR